MYMYNIYCSYAHVHVHVYVYVHVYVCLTERMAQIVANHVQCKHVL